MIKYIPIIQMVGMLLLNMLYDIFNINFYKIYDFIFENSMIMTMTMIEKKDIILAVKEIVVAVDVIAVINV